MVVRFMYDIIIPTWNSAETLPQCLDSIRQHSKPDNVIIIDRKSKDGTQAIAEGVECVVLTDTISLGSARMMGIRHSTAPLVAFVDSDIVIGKDWHTNMLSYLDKKTGAIQGRTILTSSPIREMRLHDARTNLFKDGIRRLAKGDRGFTNTTIIRRNLLLDLDISQVNAWEDWFITQAVLDKGYEWKYVPVFVDHLESSEDWLRKLVWGVKGRRHMFDITNTGMKLRLKTSLLSLSWYLKQIVQYSAVLGDKRIPLLFGRGLIQELKGMVV